jgi:rfaE bifunctional protein nucleotidyltransferase chain/domain
VRHTRSVHPTPREAFDASQFRSEILTGEIELPEEETSTTSTSTRIRAAVESYLAEGNATKGEATCRASSADLAWVQRICRKHYLDRLRRASTSFAESTPNSQRRKPLLRPIVGERERGRILAALAAVDAVIVFGDPTPLQLIEALRPDVIVKGGDYSEDSVVGAKEVRSWGGRVKIVPTVEGFSTTKLIAKATMPA